MLNKDLFKKFIKGLFGKQKAKTVVTSNKDKLNAKSFTDVELIKASEQLRLKAYMPTRNDVPTIGYGHTSNVKMGDVITEAQAEQLLKQDLAWVEAAIAKYVKVPLNINQYDALGSFIFNLGAGNFSSSTLLRKLNAGDYTGAANEFYKWNKQRNKTTGKLEVLRGLTIRRAEEKRLFLTEV